MLSLAADRPYDTIDDTARLPTLPASFLPESPADEASAALENPTPRAADLNVAVLGPTLRFKGDLSAQEDFILQGRIEGSIHQAQRIVVACGGAVVGTIHARVVVVDGNVQGDVYGMESVTVHKTGRVLGNIFAPRVVLIDGAFFNGRIDMSGGSVVDRDGIAGKTAAEPTDNVLTQKVKLVLPPPPVRDRAGQAAIG